ncbi:MAG: helix-turn-helix transcriptional regulator [Alphaproteobacteria bacterium]|jgi:y4mF family transcriptional regulator|nr:helix-turn-helix transcriptional regulator [Alphaproteobacteria bacterium]
MKIKTAQDIAILIKTERKKQNLTQTELAGLCNVGLRFIVDVEAGKETCQIGKVLKVLDVLGININSEE